MLRVLIAMTVASGSAAFGQILVRRGMQQVGALESYIPADLAVYFWHTVSNPYVIGGTVLNTVFYVLFLAALSWTDVTVALPMTALEYGFAAVLAVMILKEVVSPLRWAGILLIVLGVILINMGGGETPAPSAVAMTGKSV
jgi:drug/metabolite transporter (DMT)-like permease